MPAEMPDLDTLAADHRPVTAAQALPVSPRLTDADNSLFTRPRMGIAILVVLAILAAISAIQFQAPHLLGAEKSLTDYDAFHIAGLLALDGRAEDAYRFETMLAAQQEFTGTVSMMPWTYPPPFTLFVAGMANLPIGLGFLLFIVSTLAMYLVVLRRIAGVYWPGVLIVMLPTLPLLMRTGQNGFLAGALTGLFLLAFLQRKPGAGLPLGLMIIKPHLAVAMAVMTLVERRWQTVMIAAVTVAIALLIPSLVFGLSIWPAFFDGIAQSGDFLARGEYKLYRMTSLYAAAHTLGAGPALAMAIQAAGALGAIAAMLAARMRKLAPHRLAAAICCATLFISPYGYDYDLTIFGLAVAFVLPDLLQRTRPLEQIGMVALVWLGTGYGLVRSLSVETISPASAMAGAVAADQFLSVMGPVLLIVIALGTHILARAPHPDEDVARPGNGLRPGVLPAAPAA